VARASQERLLELAQAAIGRAGARPAMALAAARHLVRAEAQGLASHGMSRVPFYCSMLANGRADGRAAPVVVRERPGACLIDNRDALPYEACELALAEAGRRAAECGVAIAGITNSGHVGVLGIHLQALAGQGLAGFAFTNSPAAIPPWGGKTALFGTNPVAAAFPRRGAPPLVIDLALTTVVRGRIMLAAQKGERIPEGWALDRHGRPTTDAKEAIERGSLFPIGGAKGAMLALMVELVCSALTGAAFGREADSFFSEQGNRPRTGQAFLAVDPGALAGRERYLERVEAIVAAMLADEGVRLPGARRFDAEARARGAELEIPDDLFAKIVRLAGVQSPG
jgi:(2R)-3-sulfolactate dehydrogenase (NADP+)